MSLFRFTNAINFQLLYQTDRLFSNSNCSGILIIIIYYYYSTNICFPRKIEKNFFLKNLQLSNENLVHRSDYLSSKMGKNFARSRWSEFAKENTANDHACTQLAHRGVERRVGARTSARHASVAAGDARCRSPSNAEHSLCPAAGISRIDQPPSRLAHPPPPPSPLSPPLPPLSPPRVFLFLRPSPRIINAHRSFLLFIS